MNNTHTNTILPIHRLLVEWAVRQSLLNSRAYRLALSGCFPLSESDMWAERAVGEWAGNWTVHYGNAVADEMRAAFVGMYCDVLELASS